uniref:cyclin-T1-like n=1 Tax=Myxine glutinosa TaxID=7769 RepID=UPI00358FD8A3
MAARWSFSAGRLLDTPSRRCGLNRERELAARQQTAEQIYLLGQHLGVSQLTISTAIVYMRRFYMFHSFTKVQGNAIAQAALFLAAKVEEQQLKLEHVLRMAHSQFKAHEPLPDPKSKTYMKLSQDIIMLESVLLQTIGFDITIDHPHAHVIRCMQFVTASRELAQTSYFMATNR